MVYGGALVRALKAPQPVLAFLTAILFDHNFVGHRAGHCARLCAFVDDHVPGIQRRTFLDAGGYQRRLRLQQRHRLALHVRSHQRPICVIVFQERDHRCRDTHHLLRRDIDHVDIFARPLVEVRAGTNRHPLRHDRAIFTKLGVGLGNDQALFHVRSEILDVVSHKRFHADGDPIGLLELLELLNKFLRNLCSFAPQRLAVFALQPQRLVVFVLQAFPQSAAQGLGGLLRSEVFPDHPVRRLQESVVIYLGVRGQRADQPDVRPFRSLNRAYAAVVAEVDVTDVESRPLAAQPTRPHRAQAPLVGKLGQRVCLVHELRELASAEKFLHRGHHRAGVNQHRRRRLGRVLDRHPLLDHPLHAQQAGAKLILQKLPNRAHPAVTKVVDLVGTTLRGVQPHDLPDQRQQVFPPQCAFGVFGRHAQPFVQLVPPDPTQIVASKVKEQLVQQRASVFLRRRIARPQPVIHIHQALFVGLRRVVPDIANPDGGLDVAVLGVGINVLEQLVYFLVGAPAKRAQQGRHRNLALAVHLDADDVLGRGVEFEPGPAVRDQFRREQSAVGRGVDIGREVRPRRPHQLTHHNPLGTVVNEGPFVRHQGKITHEDRRFFDFPGLLIVKPCHHPQRRLVGAVLVAAFLFAVLRLVKRILRHFEVQFQVLPGEVQDRRDLLEEFVQPLIAKPAERPSLDIDQVGKLQDVRSLPKLASGDQTVGTGGGHAG